MAFTNGKRMSGGVSRNTATITRDSMGHVFIGRDISGGLRDAEVVRERISGAGFKGL